MAFMMPVMKNEWDIYRTNRSRRSSECSNPRSCRNRKVAEFSKSAGTSLSTSPSGFLAAPVPRSAPLTPRRSLRASSRHSSRASSGPSSGTSSSTSQSSLQSSSKSTSSSFSKTSSSSSLNKFHTCLVDKLKRSLKKGDDEEEDQRNLS